MKYIVTATKPKVIAIQPNFSQKDTVFSFALNNFIVKSIKIMLICTAKIKNDNKYGIFELYV